MKKSTIIAALLFATAASTGAFAKTLTGTITSISTKNDQITLANGRTFKLPEKIEVQNFKTGEKVKVSYTATKNGHVTISSVEPAM